MLIRWGEPLRRTEGLILKLKLGCILFPSDEHLETGPRILVIEKFD